MATCADLSTRDHHSDVCADNAGACLDSMLHALCTVLNPPLLSALHSFCLRGIPPSDNACVSA